MVSPYGISFVMRMKTRHSNSYLLNILLITLPGKQITYITQSGSGLSSLIDKPHATHTNNPVSPTAMLMPVNQNGRDTIKTTIPQR